MSDVARSPSHDLWLFNTIHMSQLNSEAAVMDRRSSLGLFRWQLSEQVSQKYIRIDFSSSSSVVKQSVVKPLCSEMLLLSGWQSILKKRCKRQSKCINWLIWGIFASMHWPQEHEHMHANRVACDTLWVVSSRPSLNASQDLFHRTKNAPICWIRERITLYCFYASSLLLNYREFVLRELSSILLLLHCLANIRNMVIHHICAILGEMRKLPAIDIFLRDRSTTLYLSKIQMKQS